jgi:hypothetical protein
MEIDTMSQAQKTTVAQAVAAAYALKDEAIKAVRAESANLAAADTAFESGLSKVATNMARLLGDAPSFDHWEAVAKEFQAGYAAAKKCTEETARKRWVALCGRMETEFALTKPAKPTKAAEVKAAQREGAAKEAADLIERTKATTPAAIIALTQQAGLKAPVVAALGKMAGEVAKAAGKAANDAAREEAKKLREEVRQSLAALSLDNLRKVRDTVAAMIAAQNPAPAEPATPATPATPADPVSTEEVPAAS